MDAKRRLPCTYQCFLHVWCIFWNEQFSGKTLVQGSLTLSFWTLTIVAFGSAKKVDLVITPSCICNWASLIEAWEPYLRLTIINPLLSWSYPFLTLDIAYISSALEISIPSSRVILWRAPTIFSIPVVVILCDKNLQLLIHKNVVHALFILASCLSDFLARIIIVVLGF